MRVYVLGESCARVFMATKNEVRDVKGISTVLCNQYELKTYP